MGRFKKDIDEKPMRYFRLDIVRHLNGAAPGNDNGNSFVSDSGAANEENNRPENVASTSRGQKRAAPNTDGSDPLWGHTVKRRRYEEPSKDTYEWIFSEPIDVILPPGYQMNTRACKENRPQNHIDYLVRYNVAQPVNIEEIAQILQEPEGENPAEEGQEENRGNTPTIADDSRQAANDSPARSETSSDGNYEISFPSPPQSVYLNLGSEESDLLEDWIDVQATGDGPHNGRSINSTMRRPSDESILSELNLGSGDHYVPSNYTLGSTLSSYSGYEADVSEETDGTVDGPTDDVSSGSND